MTKAETKRSLIRTLELHAVVLEATVPPKAWNDHSPDERSCLHMGRARWSIWTTAAAHERMMKNFRRLKLASVQPWTYHEKACEACRPPRPWNSEVQ